MLTYEREEYKEEGGREGRMGGAAWNGGKEKGERGKPIESCLNKVWELEMWKSEIQSCERQERNLNKMWEYMKRGEMEGGRLEKEKG
jgi:hypothetical protein